MAKPRQRTQSVAKKLGLGTLDGHDSRRKTHLHDTLKTDMQLGFSLDTRCEDSWTEIQKQTATSLSSCEAEFYAGEELSTTSVTDTKQPKPINLPRVKQIGFGVNKMDYDIEDSKQ